MAAAGFALFGAAAVAAIDPGSARTAIGLPVSTTVTVPQAVDRVCFRDRLADAAGVATFDVPPTLEGAAFGVLHARLDAVSGDWDLAIFDAAGEVVAASASTGASEVASGFLTEDGPLSVQACRISGGATQAAIEVSLDQVEESETEKTSLAFVETPRRMDKEAVQSLGLDLTEHGGEDHLAVILHGPDDKAALERAGLDFEVQVPDLARLSARQRAADAEYAAKTQRSSLPSGRETYRRLFHYEQELKNLVTDNPDLVRPITLKHKTYEGRTVEGIEITTDVDNLRDGKPVFLQMGLHHAREWPSGEHAMEWAYQLLKGYENGNERVRRLVEKTRTIVIPVVNPDGFNTSREAGQQQGSGNGEDGTFYESAASSPNEYRRKNCRRFDDDESGDCLQPAFGVKALGVDPNRNYGGLWGGPGASEIPVDEDYRGPGPFSEPETKNVRELVSGRQVTVAISNHTFSNLVIRPPSLESDPDAVDEPLYKRLGDAMAAENGYVSQHSWELYDTSGGYEDWAYYATGGLGFTFEIFCNHITTPIDPRCSGNFHPTFPNVVAEYDGTSEDAVAIGGEGNREAFFIAHEAALDPAKHSVLEGKAPPGAILKIEKTFTTATRNENFPPFKDHLDSELKVPDSGNYDWHINPSTRPIVALATGRPTLGPPSDPPPEQVGTNATTTPCADFDTTDPTCWNDHPFTVPGAPNDNDTATVDLSWTNPVNDWDLKVFRDVDGDGTSTVERDPEEVGQSGNSPPGNSETTTVDEPEAGDGRLEPGKYVARVINYAAVSPDPYSLTVTFEGPPPFEPAKTETWSFTCTYAGEKRVTDDILIARGERQKPDLSACAVPDGGAGRCLGAKATLVGSKGNDKMIGTNKRDVIIGLGGRDKIKGRGGNDIICAKGGDDRLKGGGGADRLGGGGGRDRVSGGGGRDTLKGGARPDKLSGGGGKDRLIGGGGRDKLNGGGGKDRCSGRRDRIRHC